jgi:hypothetical protein
MELKTQIIPACEFLRTTARGELDFPRAKALLKQAVGGEAHEAAEILLDFREAISCGPLSPAQIWHLVQIFEEHPSLHWRRVALLLGPEAPGTKAELFQLSANNRGFRVEVFYNFEEALYWLALPKGIEPSERR